MLYLAVSISARAYRCSGTSISGEARASTLPGCQSCLRCSSQLLLGLPNLWHMFQSCGKSSRPVLPAQVMVQAGPWHARLLALGAAHMQRIEESLLEGQDLSQAVVHHPCARLVVLQRTSARL